MKALNELKFESIGVESLCNEGLKNIEGGGLWDKIIGFTISYIAGEVLEGLQRSCK